MSEVVLGIRPEYGIRVVRICAHKSVCEEFSEIFEGYPKGRGG